MSFNKNLKSLIQSKKSHLCIGLDVDEAKLPQSVLSSKDPILTFNQQIIKYTEDIAVAYKLNLAFYEAMGERGYGESMSFRINPASVVPSVTAQRSQHCSEEDVLVPSSRQSAGASSRIPMSTSRSTNLAETRSRCRRQTGDASAAWRTS